MLPHECPNRLDIDTLYKNYVRSSCFDCVMDACFSFSFRMMLYSTSFVFHMDTNVVNVCTIGKVSF